MPHSSLDGAFSW